MTDNHRLQSSGELAEALHEELLLAQSVVQALEIALWANGTDRNLDLVLANGGNIALRQSSLACRMIGECVEMSDTLIGRIEQ